MAFHTLCSTTAFGQPTITPPRGQGYIRATRPPGLKGSIRQQVHYHSRRSGMVRASQDELGPEQPEFGTEEWLSRPAAVALPSTARTPGAWFTLAGFLKILLVSQPFSPFAQMLDTLGVALPLGPFALLSMIPVAATLGYAAKYIVDNQLHTRKNVIRGVLLASIGLLWFFRSFMGSSIHERVPPAHAVRAAQARRSAEQSASGTPAPRSTSQPVVPPSQANAPTRHVK